jgi:hypothetical protein
MPVMTVIVRIDAALIAFPAPGCLAFTSNESP